MTDFNAEDSVLVEVLGLSDVFGGFDEDDDTEAEGFLPIFVEAEG